MEVLTVNAQLSSADLFAMFKEQLRKDFEGAGLPSGFIGSLPADHAIITNALLAELSLMGAEKLAALLYRVDISERQLKEFGAANEQAGFTEVVVELIIRRVLQKVVIRRSFGNRHEH